MSSGQNKRYEFEDDWLSRRYQSLSNESPDEKTDDAILAAARKNTSKPARLAGPFSGKWRIPAALAATVLVTVSIVPTLYKQSTDQLDYEVATERSMPAPTAAPRALVAPAEEAQDSSDLIEVEEESKIISSSSQSELKEEASTGIMSDDAIYNSEQSASVRAQSPTTLSTMPQAPELVRKKLVKAKEAAEQNIQEEAVKTKNMMPKKQLPRMELDKEIAANWLAEIERLISEGQLSEAKRQLAIIRKLDPTFELPSDLEKKLKLIQ